jgi:hypothetical protein
MRVSELSFLCLVAARIKMDRLSLVSPHRMNLRTSLRKTIK